MMISNAPIITTESISGSIISRQFIEIDEALDKDRIDHGDRSRFGGVEQTRADPAQNHHRQSSAHSPSSAT